MKLEIIKQHSLKNLEGWILTLWIHDGKEESPQSYFFKTVDDLSQWLRINFDDAYSGKLGQCP